MKCSNCKKKIDNPDLFRCPHCGKPLKKKKEIDKGDVALNIAYSVVMISFVVISFISYFFDCIYYSTPIMIIAAIVMMITIPFTFGNFGITESQTDIIAIASSVPLIINWIMVFVRNIESLDRGGLYSAYYISVVASIAVVDIILALDAAGIIKHKGVISWIAFGIAFAIAGFTIFFYTDQALVKPFAIAVIAVQSFTIPYVAFHVLRKEISRR